MRRAIRLALAAVGVGLVVWGTLQWESGEGTPEIVTYPAGGGTMTMREVGSISDLGVAAVLAGLGCCSSRCSGLARG